MGILSGITSVAVSGIWKVGAIALLAGMVTSSAYLGYQWHSAAGERDTAITERTKAEGERNAALAENGELTAHIVNQNRSIKELESQTTAAKAQYATAMALYSPIKAGIKALADRLAAQAPSATCAQSLSKQRQAIDGLRVMSK